MGIFDLIPKRKQVEEEQEQVKTLDERIVDKIRLVYDPEIPVNVYEMGLIYKVDLDEAARKVDIEMTLTSPQCPEAERIPVDIKNRVEELDEIDTTDVNIVWEPMWTPEAMSEEARLELGFF